MTDTSNGANAVAWKAAGLGAVAVVVLAPLAAAIVATVYRFPIPLGEYARGSDDAGSAALGSLFYLVLGGAPALAILGAASGFVAAKRVRTARHVRFWTLLAAMVVALLGATALAVLEFIVGPW